MKLLVLTQAVDLDDPVLGFFHQWLEEFGGCFDSLHVVCLKEGKHRLPAHVSVHSLGKESGRSVFKYLARFYTYAWKLRSEYDAVFVHMNQEYVLLGGAMWRLLGKKVVLWRNHKAGSLFTRIAAALAHTVCYTSPSAYVAGYGNAVRMPLGIDTNAFTPSAELPPRRSVLFFGRLDPVKCPEVFIDSLKLIRGRTHVQADIYGEPSQDASYGKALASRAEELVAQGVLTFHGAVPHREAPHIFRSHAVYVNLTPSGSFDKTIGEALAAGCISVVANTALRDVSSRVVTEVSSEKAAAALQKALELPEEERERECARLRSWVVTEHSLPVLARKLRELFV